MLKGAVFLNTEFIDITNLLYMCIEHSLKKDGSAFIFVNPVNRMTYKSYFSSNSRMLVPEETEEVGVIRYSDFHKGRKVVAYIKDFYLHRVGGPALTFGKKHLFFLNGKEIPLEDYLELMPDDKKEEILFNLDKYT